ncbi:MAG: sugar tyrosine-protein kinase, partial [Opitutales bacterium]|nr:sugar tyrosine-protein kinase [Opitutales bacterium]
MNPYSDMITFGPKRTEEEILAQNRKIVPERMSLIVRVVYEHPDAQIAAKIANLFATEYISYTHQVKVQKLMNSIDELRTKVSQQEAKVKELDKKLVEYRKTHGAVSLDQIDDVDRNELREINSILTTDKRVFDAMSTQWNLVQEYTRAKKDLCTLPFIAEIPAVAKLVTDRSMQKVVVAGNEKRYKEKHPKMIEARKGLDQIEKELQVAVDSACAKIRASYENAKQNYEQSQKRLSVKKEAILELGQKAIIYKSIERERLVAEGMHQSLIQSLNVRTAQVSLINEGANIVDRAGISPRPSSPNYILNIVLGIFAGIAGGIAMAFLVAFFDDRTKSSYDVESVIGLPLLGVIPRIKRLSSSEKAQVAASNADRATTEAFRSLHSTLKVNSLSKNAKVILFTSTTPSEGK